MTGDDSNTFSPFGSKPVTNIGLSGLSAVGVALA
jgi:hypothetical protein